METIAAEVRVLLEKVTYRGSRGNLIWRVGLPMLPVGYWGWSGVTNGGVDAILGWLSALVFAAGSVVVLAQLFNPPRLTLGPDGFSLRSPLWKGGVIVRWSDVANVGLYTRQRLSLKGDRPPETLGIGYNFKPSRLSGKRQRQAMGVLGATGWHGVIDDGWNVPNSHLLEAFHHYLDASRASGQVTAALPKATASSG